jgi:hypothetical protein
MYIIEVEEYVVIYLQQSDENVEVSDLSTTNGTATRHQSSTRSENPVHLRRKDIPAWLLETLSCRYQTSTLLEWPS